MFLVDTSVWLEVLLDQDRSDDARSFLTSIPVSDLCITDFSVYSIGIIAERKDEFQVYEDFLQDTVDVPDFTVVRLEHGLHKIKKCKEEEGLDFDDSYQYIAASQFDLSLVSFDDDFDVTPEGRLTPEDALEKYRGDREK